MNHMIFYFKKQINVMWLDVYYNFITPLWEKFTENLLLVKMVAMVSFYPILSKLGISMLRIFTKINSLMSLIIQNKI